MRRRWVLGTLVLGLVLATGAEMAGAATSAGFGAPVRVLGGRLLHGIDMGVDPDGRVHVVASGLHSGRGGLWYATNRTGAWRVKRLVAWSPGAFWVDPAIAVDGLGRVHIAVTKAGCVECTIAPVKGVFVTTDRGRPRGSFGPLLRWTDAGTAQPSIRFDARRTFLAFAGNADLAPAPVRVWSTAFQSITHDRITIAGTEPFLRIGMDGRPRLVYRVDAGIRYAVARSVTGGYTSEAIGSSNATSHLPALSIDENGGAHATWVDQAAGWEVRYAQRTGGIWQPAVTVGAGWVGALSVDKPATPWVAVGSDTLDVYRPVGGVFQGIRLADGMVNDVAIKVLDSGRVIVAWTRGSGLWVIRS